jgi:hypothetical protein
MESGYVGASDSIEKKSATSVDILYSTSLKKKDQTIIIMFWSRIEYKTRNGERRQLKTNKNNDHAVLYVQT